jgi:hypothetical protein
LLPPEDGRCSNFSLVAGLTTSLGFYFNADGLIESVLQNLNTANISLSISANFFGEVFFSYLFFKCLSILLGGLFIFGALKSCSGFSVFAHSNTQSLVMCLLLIALANSSHKYL